MKRFQNLLWIRGEMTGGKLESTHTCAAALSIAITIIRTWLSTTVQRVYAFRVAATFTTWTLTWVYTVTASTRKSTKFTTTADLIRPAWRNTGIADRKGSDEQKYHNHSIAIVRGLLRDCTHRKGFHASLHGRCVLLSLLEGSELSVSE